MPVRSIMHLSFIPIFFLATLLSSPITHGPIIGNLTSERVHIFVRSASPGNVSIDLVNDGEGHKGRLSNITTVTETDNTKTLVMTNLLPDTRYEYSVNGKRNNNWWFQTRPEVDKKCRIAFGSCADEGEGSSSVWKRIEEEGTTALVLLGDTPYIDTTNLKVQRKRYKDFASVPSFAKLISHTPLYSTWDDHDFGRNDSDGNLEGKENSRQAFSEYRPNPSFGENNQGIYTSFKQGSAEIFLLDTRWFAGTETKDSKPTLLGEQQWKWLERSLAASSSPYKILACGMVFNNAVRPFKKDYWGGYPSEYKRLLDLIAKIDATGVILVSGDIHWSRVIRHDTSKQIGYDLHEFITSPIHEKLIITANAPHPGLVYSIGEPNSFLLLETDVREGVEGDMETLTMSLRNASGKILYEQLFPMPPGTVSFKF